MKAPPLTIVTITMDDPAGLALTLSSAAQLRGATVEHLVVDGGGDASKETASDISGADGARILRRSPRGIADALNTGLAGAQGEWVWFLNGGDRVDPRLAPQFLLTLLENSRADVIIGATTYEGESDARPHPPGRLQWPPSRSWIPHPSTLVRRRLFIQFGGFDTRYSIAMDYEWWLRVLSNGIPVDILNIPLAVFAPGGLSQRAEFRATIQRERYDAIRRHHAALWRSWVSVGCRLLRDWTFAVFARRLGRIPHSP